MSKTGLQTQQAVGWAAEYVARSNCRFWMGIGNYPVLDCDVIGRVYWDQDDTDRVVGLGAAGADLVWAKAEAAVRANPHVHCWQLVNEASIWNSTVRAGFAAFNQRLSAKLAGVGARHVCGNVNVGHPSADYWDAGIRAIGEATRGAAYLGLHGYSWPSLETGWPDLVGRFERIYAALRAAGYAPPPCILTELGLDKAVADGVHAGWRKVPMTPAQLAEQVAWFEAQVAGNDDLAGALWFVAGAYEPWGSLGFDVDQDTAMLVADRIAGEPEEPEEGEPVGIRIIDKFGVERDWAWVESYYGNVQIADTVEGYRVTLLVETTGVMAFTATVIRDNPVVGQQVAYTWPDGQVLEITNANGVAEHQAGPGEGYAPDSMTGPISWQVAGPPSARIFGLGWLWGTDHDHLNPVFTWVSDVEPVPPDDDSDVVALLTDILAVLYATKAEIMALGDDVRLMGDEVSALRQKVAEGFTLK